MDRLLQFGALLLLLSRFEFSECVQQRFIEEPASVSVHEGENVLLSCSVDNKMGVLQWTKGIVSNYLKDKWSSSILLFRL